MRKNQKESNMLASIQQIVSLTPIPNADNIECAKVLGWDVVVKKGEFRVGDMCIYIETDTLIPRKEWSDFLFKPGTDQTHHRLKTVKLRGQVSQGLVLPLSILPNDTLCFKIGLVSTDASSTLEILKYEKPVPQSNPRSGIRIKGNFPSFLKKTDEINIQSSPKLLEQLKGNPYYITQKMDGTSATFYKHEGKFGVCSRNVEIKNPKSYEGLIQHLKREFYKFIGRVPKNVPSTNVYWRMVEKYKIDEWIKNEMCIQGEICGPGIQENKIGLKEVVLYVFNVYHILSGTYFTPHIVLENSGIDLVPVLEAGNTFNYTIEQLVEKAKAHCYPNEGLEEGIVVRSSNELVSFKVKNPDFLLKYGE
jgi:RNA ligase (TIGR02306 family)